ncbi:hypothetical protein AVEN_173241-1 [Araneus ventricosus]|uniref:Uncharacterized protein n=1 Tax=Araneus ventricosus TaxID=182803 RepID=A0A4Y2B7A2_ARAVE|nr:hypothetical protein AVEN_173241-1 [Araneus ventricosus]
MRHPSHCGKSPLVSSADEVAGSDNHLPFQPQSSLFTDRNNIFWTAHYVRRGSGAISGVGIDKEVRCQPSPLDVRRRPASADGRPVSN